MSAPWINPALSVVVAVGIGGSCLGLIGLLRKPRARWLPAPLARALALTGAGFCTAAVLLGQPAAVWLPPAFLLALCVPLCGLPAREAGWLRGLALNRRLQAAGLLLLCPLLTWAWVCHLTAQTDLLADTWAGTELPPDDWTYEEVSPAVAHTDTGRPVKVYRRTGTWTPESVAPQQALLLRQWGAEDRVIAIPGRAQWCNCHGWVFTGGRYFLLEEELAEILKDNGYQPVKAPQAGDLVLYRDHTDWPLHSGIVRVVHPDLPVLVESKWGDLGRFLHPVAMQPYRGTRVCYYRSARPSHILRGLEDPTRPSPVALRGRRPGERPGAGSAGGVPAPAKRDDAE
jgi:hypothetical protein